MNHLKLKWMFIVRSFDVYAKASSASTLVKIWATSTWSKAGRPRIEIKGSFLLVTVSVYISRQLSHIYIYIYIILQITGV